MEVLKIKTPTDKSLPTELSTQALKLKQPHHCKCVHRSPRDQENTYLIAWSHKGKNLKTRFITQILTFSTSQNAA